MDAGSWALSQAKNQVGTIDFDKNCHTRPNPIFSYGGVTYSEADQPPASWIKPCRTISGRQLRAILDVGLRSISLSNVVIVPDVDGLPVNLTDSDSETRLAISNVDVPTGIDFTGSSFLSFSFQSGWIGYGGLTMDGMTIAGSLSLATLKVGSVSMIGAQVSDTANLSDLIGDGDRIDGTGILVGHNFVVEAPLDGFGEINLSNSVIKGSISIANGSDLDDEISGLVVCLECTVGGDLDFDAGLYFSQAVVFRKATINGVVSINPGEFHDVPGTIFDSLLQFSDSEIGSVVTYGGVRLQTFSVTDSEIGDSFVFKSDDHRLSSDSMDPLIGPESVVAGPAKLQTLDLTGTTIKGRLDLSGLAASYSWQSKNNNTVSLNLSDLAVGAFTDCNDSWPDSVNLVDFTYGRIVSPGCRESLYNFDESTVSVNSAPHDVPPPSADHWRNWLETHDHGPDFNPQPYLFMAKYFASLGEQDWSNTILYELRSLETAELGHRHPRSLEYVSQSVFGFCAGYELGDYGLTHIARTILITWLIGILALLTSSRARQRGLLWCAGASTERLLPLVQFRESYRQFFNGPEGMSAISSLQGSKKHKMRLRRVYYTFFDLYSLWGWILGTWLVAVVAGLTAK